MALADTAAAWGAGLNVIGNTITQIALMNYAKKLAGEAESAPTDSEKQAIDKKKYESTKISGKESPLEMIMKAAGSLVPSNVPAQRQQQQASGIVENSRKYIDANLDKTRGLGGMKNFSVPQIMSQRVY